MSDEETITRDRRVVAADQRALDAHRVFTERRRARLEAEEAAVTALHTAQAAEAKFRSDGADAWPALKIARDASEMRSALLIRADQSEAAAKLALDEADVSATEVREMVRLETIAKENRELADATAPLFRHLAKHLKVAQVHHESSNGASSIDGFLRAIGVHLWEACQAEGVPSFVLRKESIEELWPSLMPSQIGQST